MQIITIDGPASSGKGTVSKLIAKKLGYHYLESGSIYRSIAFITERNAIMLSDINKILVLIDTIQLKYIADKIMLNDEDVTQLLRAEKIGLLASTLAANSEIRSKLLDFQRGFANPPGLVTDGRDMGSVIFPEADLKIFLTASAEKRANRRFLQLHKLDKSATIQSILHDIQARDKQDLSRGIAPLSYDKSFKYLDNSGMTIDETVTTIINWYNEKFL